MTVEKKKPAAAKRKGKKMATTESKEENVFTCELCKINYVTEEEIKEHFWSLMHHIKIEQKQKNSPHNCTLCFSSCTNVLEYGKHLNEDKHKRAQEEIKRQKEIKEMEIKKQEREKLRSEREEMEIDTKSSNSCHEKSTVSRGQNRTEIYDKQPHHMEQAPSDTWNSTHASTPEHRYQTFNTNDCWNQDSVYSRGLNEQQNYFRKPSFSYRSWKDERGWFQRPRNSIPFDWKPPISEPQYNGFNQRRRSFGDDHWNHNNRNSLDTDCGMNSMQSGPWPSSEFSSEWNEPSKRNSIDNTEWWGNYKTHNDFHTDKNFVDFSSYISRNSNPSSNSNQNCNIHDKMPDETQKQNIPPRKYQGVTESIKGISSPIDSPDTQSPQRTKKECSSSVKRRYEGDDSGSRRSSRERQKARRCMSSPSHSPSQDFLRSPTVIGKNSKHSKLEKQSVVSKFSPSALSSKTTINTRKKRMNIKDTSSLSSLSSVSSSASNISSLSSGSSSQGSTRKKKKKKKKKNVGKGLQQVTPSKDGQLSSNVNISQKETQNSKSQVTSTVSKKLERKLDSTNEKLSKEKKFSVCTRSHNQLINCKSSSPDGRRFDNILERAQKLCSELRDKRRLAKLDKDRKEKQIKKAEQSKLDKQIEELNTINRSYVKGHLSSEAAKLGRDTCNSKKKVLHHADNISNDKTCTNSANSLKMNVKSVHGSKESTSLSPKKNSEPSSKIVCEVKVTGSSHNHGLRSKGKAVITNSLSDSERRRQKVHRERAKTPHSKSSTDTKSHERNFVDSPKQDNHSPLPSCSKSLLRSTNTSDSEQRDSEVSCSPLRKDVLLKMIHSPRSRKERIKLAELLKKHTKPQNRFAIPRYNLHQLSQENISSAKDVTELNIAELPTDVQLQIAELIGKDFNDDVEESVNDFQRPLELMDFLPVPEIAGDSDITTNTSSNSLIPNYTENLSSHDLIDNNSSKVVKEETLTADDVTGIKQELDVDKKGINDLLPVLPDSSSSVMLPKNENLNTLSSVDTSSGFQSGNCFQSLNKDSLHQSNPNHIKAEDSATETDSTSTKGYFTKVLPKLNLDSTVESVSENPGNVSRKPCETESMEIEMDIKVEPIDSNTVINDHQTESVSDSPITEVKPEVSSCTSENKPLDVDSIDDIVDKYLKKSTECIVKKCEPDITDTGQQSPDSSTANISDLLQSEKVDESTNATTVPHRDLETNPPDDILAASTSSINSQSSTVSSIFDGVLKLTMKEEEIRKEINTVGDRIGHLRKIIEDASLQLGRYEEKRTKLLHEEEIYRAQRLKLLQDALNPQVANSSSDSLTVSISSRTESFPSSTSHSPRKDKNVREIRSVDSPGRIESHPEQISSTNVHVGTIPNGVSESSRLIRTTFCKQYDQSFKAKSTESSCQRSQQSDSKSHSSLDSTSKSHQDSTNLQKSLMFHSNGDMERTFNRGVVDKSDDSVVDDILLNKLAESLENTRKIASSVLGENVSSLYPTSIKKESGVTSLPPIKESQVLETSFNGSVSKRGEDIIEEVDSDSHNGSIDSDKVSLGEKIKIYCDTVNDTDNSVVVCDPSERGGHEESDLSEQELTHLKNKEYHSASDIFLQSDAGSVKEDTPGRKVRECSSVLESLNIDVDNDKNDSDMDDDIELRSYCPLRVHQTDESEKTAFKKKLKTKKERDLSSKHKFETWMDSSSSDRTCHEDDVLPTLSKLKVRLRFNKNKKSDDSQKVVSLSDSEELCSQAVDNNSVQQSKDDVKNTAPATNSSSSKLSQIPRSSLTFESRNLQNLRLSMVDFMKTRTYCGKNSEPVQYKGPSNSVIAIAVYKGFLYVAYQNDEVRKFNTETGDCVFWYDISGCGIKCIKLLPTDTAMDKLVVGGNKLLTYDTKSGLIHTIEELEENERVHCLHFDWNTLYIGLASGNIFAKNWKANKTVDTFRCANRPVMCMASATEGSRKLLVVGAQDAMISLLDARSGILIRCLEGHTKTVFALWVENQYIFSGSGDKSVMVHNLHTGELKHTYPDHKAIVTGLESSGDMLITVSYDKLLRCYDRKTHTLKQLYYGAGNDVVTSLCVQGSQLYTGNREGLVEGIKLQFDSKIVCQFEKCGVTFGLENHLLHHIMTDHMIATSKLIVCRWKGCQEKISNDSTKEKIEEHLLKHITEAT